MDHYVTKPLVREALRRALIEVTRPEPNRQPVCPSRQQPTLRLQESQPAGFFSGE